MLRITRIVLQIFSIICLTLLFLDFTGSLQPWFGWLAKIQLLPAALNHPAPIILILLLLATFVFGRLYCSIVCPMGIVQDFFNWLGVKRKRNRFHYSAENRWLRFIVLAVFIVLFVVGLSSYAALIDPYSIYGRICNNLFSPLYRYVNNLAADYAVAHDSLAFYHIDNAFAPRLMMYISGGTLLLFAVLSFFVGRWWCSNVCPVGTALSLVSRFALIRPVIDTSKCNGCKVCAHRCKASCINPKEHKVDMANCVVCFDCIGNCHQGAISFGLRRFCRHEGKKTAGSIDSSRRNFLTGAVALGSLSAVDAVAKTVDGGLTIIEDKKAPKRAVRLVPAGALSIDHFAQHCTACQLCVSNCPNHVLRPSMGLNSFMQPEMSYELGHCRPECTRCSEVCPSGAIKPIVRIEKSSTQIGHAVWIAANCVVNTDHVSCGNCARHCPTGAISMVPKGNLRIPAVDTERCIGCGACEHLCPARPFSAIYVEGHKEHRII